MPCCKDHRYPIRRDFKRASETPQMQAKSRRDFNADGGPFRDIHRSFLRALGSPNYFNHDCTCARNTQHAAISLFGGGRKTFNYDYSRNVLESMRVKNANAIIDLLDRGGKITYIDVRAAGTAMKATRFWMIRPGTDYALNLGIIHTVLEL
ncbi:hypothetical protein ACFL2O_11715 [Thermodesulfobacteriota bacterium]